MDDPARSQFETGDPFDPPEWDSAAPAIADILKPVAQKQTWSVGSLTYDKRGLTRLFAWLQCGDFCWQIKDRSVRDVVRLVLYKFGISNAMYSVVMNTLPGILSLLLGPIVSFKSDRYRSRWGRRRPFLMVSVPICAAMMFLMAFSPAMGSRVDHLLGRHSLGLDNTILILFGINWTLFECFAIIAGSVHGAFVNDVVPHSVLARFYGVARLLSLAAGVLFMSGVFGKAAQYYVPIFIGVGLLYGVGFTLAVVMVKEGAYPPSPVSSGPPSRLRPVKEYCKDCFTKPYYFWVFAAMLLPGFASKPIDDFNLFFSLKVGMSNALYGNLMSFYFVLSMFQAVPLGWLADKFHPLRVAMVALVLHGAVALWGGWCIHGLKSFALAYVLTGTLSGTWATATAAMGQMLLPKAKFAQYSSAFGLISAVAGLPFSPLVGELLDRTHNTYRYAYMIGGVFDVLSLAATLVVYRKFLALGGQKSYVPPE